MGKEPSELWELLIPVSSAMASTRHQLLSDSRNLFISISGTVDTSQLQLEGFTNLELRALPKLKCESCVFIDGFYLVSPCAQIFQLCA